MAHKLIWGLPPRTFTSNTGKPQVVGIKVGHDTGKRYPASGQRAAEKAAKRLAKEKARDHEK